MNNNYKVSFEGILAMQWYHVSIRSHIIVGHIYLSARADNLLATFCKGQWHSLQDHLRLVDDFAYSVVEVVAVVENKQKVLKELGGGI